jgi:uncharacterized membrane protein
MPMTRADRVFWSIVVIILVGIFWVKFLELYLSAWFALVVGLAIATLIIRFGDKLSPEHLIKVAIGKVRKRSSS